MINPWSRQVGTGRITVKNVTHLQAAVRRLVVILTLHRKPNRRQPLRRQTFWPILPEGVGEDVTLL